MYRNRQTRRRPGSQQESGFSLIEMMTAMIVLALAGMVGAAYVVRGTSDLDWQRDRAFAHQKAASILAELRGLVNEADEHGAADLDAYDDAGAQIPTLTLTRDRLPPYDLLAPDHPLSGNTHGTDFWRWSRSIEVSTFHETDERSRRLCTVRVFRRVAGETAPGTQMAEISGIIQTMEDPLPGGHVYDLYVLAVENVPSPWMSTAAAGAFLEGALSDLQARSPGLQFNIHWITRLGFGRDEEYAPYTNVDVDTTVAMPWAYVYPGTLPLGSERTTSHAPSTFGARYKRDGEGAPYFVNDWALPEAFTDTNGNGVIDGGEEYLDLNLDSHWDPGNEAPYAFADTHNHAMRAPEARARQAARRAAAASAEDEPTWRLLLDDMVANPDRYHNALVLNLHGQTLPMPPVRNFSDAASIPETHPGWRVVTHPERLRPRRVAKDDDASEAPRFRVHAYKTAFSGSEQIMTQGEPLVDTNGNGVHDAGETWTDWNGNGVHDAALPITLSLPGGDLQARVNTATAPTLKIYRLSGGVDADGDGTAEAYAPFQPAVHLPETFTDANADQIRNPAEPWLDLDEDGVRDADEPFADLDGDGLHTLVGEAFADGNANGTWDRNQPTETFTDQNGNGRWDPAEPYLDVDGNGAWTGPTTPVLPWQPIKVQHMDNGVQMAKYLAEYGEPFLDLDGDGQYDGTAEPLEDANGNGVHDTGYARGEMYCTSRFDAASNTTIVELHGTPLEAPEDGSGAGLPAASRLYDLEYVPSPTPATAAGSDRFERDLSVAGAFPKNTARWIVEIPTAAIRSELASTPGADDGDAVDRVLQVQTRIGSDLGTGVLWPERHEPTNLSSTYAWFCDSVEDVPYSERYQFLGDPRHSPYADTDATGTSFPNGYNCWFDDLQDDGVDARALWPALDGTLLSDRWAGRSDLDVPRYLAWLREAFTRSEVFYTTLSGLAFETLSVGGDVATSTPELPDGVPMSGLPFGQGAAVIENTLYDRGTAGICGTRKFVRDRRGVDTGVRAGGSWWSKPWIGELYPDSAYAGQWKTEGNLVAGPANSAGLFQQVRRSGVPRTQQPAGTVLSDARNELGVLGGTSYFQVGAAGNTFQQGTTPVVGLIVDEGFELGQRYGMALPTGLAITNPYLLGWGGDTQVNGLSVGPEFAWTTMFPRYEAEVGSTYFAEGAASTAPLGSAIIRHVAPDERTARIGLSSLYQGTEDGTAFLGRYALLTLVNAHAQEGRPGVAQRVPQLPALSILAPVPDALYPNPTSITVKWRISWERWDKKRYTPAYPDDFEEDEEELVYRLLYSWNAGGTWQYMQDGREAQPGTLARLPDGSPDPRYAVADQNSGGDESYEWTTPLADAPDAAYLVRIEAYRRGESQHYAFKMERFDVSR
jgi:prepilin-type N-terminal cleavage/methylation domain-containing protein